MPTLRFLYSVTNFNLGTLNLTDKTHLLVRGFGFSVSSSGLSSCQSALNGISSWAQERLL